MELHFFYTIAIYLLTFISLYTFCLLGQKEKRWSLVLAGIIIYAMVFGCRYGVGVDFFAYKSIYEAELYKLVKSNVQFESGFNFIITALAKAHLHSAFFFGIISFLQLYFIFKSVKKDTYIYTYLAFTFFAGGIWLAFSNGLRQELAFCIFAFALSYTDRRHFFIHYVLILLAISMHNSALLLTIFFPILLFRKEWFKCTRVQLIVFVIAYIFGAKGIFADYLYLLEDFLSNDSVTGYGHYAEYSEKLFVDVNKGLGFYITLLTNIILIALSSKIKKEIKNDRFTIIYNFYYIGVLIKYAFIQSSIIQRINYYFYGFSFIIAAYAIYYLHKTKQQKLCLLLISLYILTFIAIMFKMNENTALFRFFWDSDII